MPQPENTPAQPAQPTQPVPANIRVVTKKLVELKFQQGMHLWQFLTSYESANEFVHRIMQFRNRRDSLQTRMAVGAFIAPREKVSRIVTGIFLDEYLPSVRFRSPVPNVTVYEHTNTIMASFEYISGFSIGNLMFETPCVVGEKPSEMDPAEMDKLFERIDVDKPEEL